MKGLKKITKQSEFYVFLLIVVLSIIIQMRSGLFFANNNIVDIVRSMIVPCIYALCAFLAFISTGPDVSFPLIAALSSYLAIVVTYKTVMTDHGFCIPDRYVFGGTWEHLRVYYSKI